MLTIHNIKLISKNNKNDKRYLYLVIGVIEGVYYYCESILSDKPLKRDNINTSDVKIKREVLPDFYEANGINIKK